MKKSDASCLINRNQNGYFNDSCFVYLIITLVWFEIFIVFRKNKK